MIVYAGNGATDQLADGAAYAPATNTWRTIAASPLTKRAGAGAVWNGARMIVFGGAGCGGICGDASSYDPAQDKWLDIAAVPAALDARIDPLPLATGPTGALATFFGGGVTGVGGARATGATYDAAANAWSPIEGLGTALLADPARQAAVAWWGAGRLWLWGGSGSGGTTDTKDDGASFDPALGTWAKIPPGGPSKRSNATVVWTGTEAIIWGGTPNAINALGDGKRFRP
jgi:N-acetylneuraminic acid mutarotase